MAAIQLGLGLWQAVAPAGFFHTLAGYGARNDHFVRDLASLYLALGATLLIAAARPSWRVPVLLFATLQYGLHALAHLLDISEADPAWIGYFDFVSLVVLTGIFAWLLGFAGGLRAITERTADAGVTQTTPAPPEPPVHPSDTEPPSELR